MAHDTDKEATYSMIITVTVQRRDGTDREFFKDSYLLMGRSIPEVCLISRAVSNSIKELLKLFGLKH